MEQLWPSSPASPSMFLGKTRIMSLENVSTHPHHGSLTGFAQFWVTGKGPLDSGQVEAGSSAPERVGRTQGAQRRWPWYGVMSSLVLAQGPQCWKM
jgi:hypothetical protein